jgi:hypothetical protein
MDQAIPLDLRTLAPLQARIAEWRTTRTHRGAPMPAALWAAAVDAAQRYGLAATARALPVDYGALKRHVTAMVSGPPAIAATFVDLGITAPRGLGACVIVLDGPRGRRLRLEVPDLRVPDLLALVQAAWSDAG